MLSAIDMHAHIFTGDRAKQPLAEAGVPSATGHQRISPDEMAQMYQRLEMMAVIFDVDQETRTGLKISNAETAGWVKKYSKTFIGYGSVDPWKGKAAVDEVGRCVDMGLRGMKFQQATQAFEPSNKRFFPIYEACIRLNLPVIFHTGTTAIYAGTPGGGVSVMRPDRVTIDRVGSANSRHHTTSVTSPKVQIMAIPDPFSGSAR